jgi:uncharacterized protein YaaW (UPF0174 family)
MSEEETKKAKKRIAVFVSFALANLLAIILVLAIMGNGNVPTAICIILTLAMLTWPVSALVNYAAYIR